MPESNSKLEIFSGARGRALLYGSLGALVVVGGGLVAYGALVQPPPKRRAAPGTRPTPGVPPKVVRGRLLCPSEQNRLPADASKVQVGDYVILKIVSHDLKYVESAWGRVLSISPGREQVYVELSTALTTTGLDPLSTDRHGFRVGEKLKVDIDCLYDVLHQSDPESLAILCGVMLSDLGFTVPESARQVKRGDFVWIVVGNPAVSSSSLPGKIWSEKIKVSVTSAGKTGDILRGLVWDKPEDPNSPSRYTPLSFTRDCIVEVQ